MGKFLEPEDYLEPSCPLCTDDWQKERPIRPIDIRRAMARLDEYLSRGDMAAAQRHLESWLAEARQSGDLRGELSLQNERMGLHRKQNHEVEALVAAEEALDLLETLGLDGSVAAGTTRVNAATVYKAFGMPRRALELYRQAQTVYEAKLPPPDARLGGLYNNMALSLSELGEPREARALFQRALDVMAQIPHSESEQAITWLNLADIAAAERGAVTAEAEACLDRAEALLDAPTLPQDGNTAFVCEKCAPVFAHYGREERAAALLARSRQIYERA